jgi:hypothetical protein
MSVATTTKYSADFYENKKCERIGRGEEYSRKAQNFYRMGYSAGHE